MESGTKPEVKKMTDNTPFHKEHDPVIPSSHPATESFPPVIVVEFSPESKAFLGALIRAIVVDPDDIKDPVVRGFLKHSEGR